ncbi:MAG TPA: hemolysin family protein [Opitutaceae bacterium]|nr:hemolysin family protein [Opitutaceae bacterium]
MPSPSTELLFLVPLVLANGTLSMAETAIVSARKSKLRQLALKGPGARQALGLAEQPSRFLALVQSWLTLSIAIAGAVGVHALADPAAAWIARVPALAGSARLIAAIAIIAVLATLLLLFGELLPKKIALAHPERTAVLLAGAVRLPMFLAGPWVRLIEATTDGLTRLLRIRPRSAADSVGDDEVRALVEQGLHAGVFQRAEKEMVEGVLALDQLRITAIMTPRPKIVFLNLDDSEESNWRKIVTSGHSYFPVYQQTRDHIVGLVAVKALWAHSAIGLPTTLKNLLMPPLLVPDTLMAIQLLEKFKQERRHIAVVTDEFGAVQGLVTLIDVFEAIVGDLPEPGQRNQAEASRGADGSWVVDATLPVGELKGMLGTDGALPQERDAEFQTVGGFVMTQFGRIPQAGDAFEWAGWRFEVAAMDRQRVEKVRVARAGPPPKAR